MAASNINILDKDGLTVALDAEGMPDGSRAQGVVSADPLTGNAEPVSSDNTLAHAVYLLNSILSRLPPVDSSFRLRCSVEAASNAAVNVTQFGGQSMVTGVGGGGNGIPRMTPSSDTLAGVTQVAAIPQAWTNTPYNQAIYAAITF